MHLECRKNTRETQELLEVAHTCDPSIREDDAGRLVLDQSGLRNQKHHLWPRRVKLGKGFNRTERLGPRSSPVRAKVGP